MVLKTLFGNTKHIYLIGIGGIGMSGIAKILISLGYAVSGSDRRSSEITSELQMMGIKVHTGSHSAHSIRQNIDVVVTSSAISPANPEIIQAKKWNIPIISRAEMLAEIMRLKRGIALAGTHGKTTTTSLTATIFTQAKLSPTTIIGGKWFAINSNAVLGKSEYLISEADESDGSFLKLMPVYSAVTNIDWDHMDYYKNKEKLMLYFLNFINKTPFYGMAFLCFDDKNVASLKDEIEKPYTPYNIIEKQKEVPKDRRGIFAKDVDYHSNRGIFLTRKRWR